MPSFSLLQSPHPRKPARLQGPRPTPRGPPRHEMPPRASGSPESSSPSWPRTPNRPTRRPTNSSRNVPSPKPRIRLSRSRIIHRRDPTSGQGIPRAYGNLLGILRLHSKESRSDPSGLTPPPGSGPASSIPCSGGRSGALKPIRRGREACSCATASRGEDHDTRRPTPGRSTRGRLGMRPDGSGASPRAASTLPGSAYAPVADASTPRTAVSACLAGSDGNTSAPSRPQWKSRTNNAGGASWNATGQSVNGGTRNAIRRRTPSPAFATTIDMRSERTSDRGVAGGAERRVSAETGFGPSIPGPFRQEPSLGARLNGSRANTRRTIGSKNSSGSES